MRPYGKPQQLEARRCRAIALLKDGETYRNTASLVKASLSSVVRWHQAYREEGMKGLRPRPTPGRPPKLSPSQKESLRGRLLAGARNAGYSTELWTLKRVARLIEKHYRVRYSLAGVWGLMRNELGWSCQKPERRALQRNEEEIAHWKRYRWPHIKKSPKT